MNFKVYRAPSNTIAAVLEVHGRWTWEEFNRMRYELLHPLFNTLGGSVHLIIDFSNTTYIPSDALAKIRNVASDLHPNFSRELVINGASYPIRAVLEASNRVFLGPVVGMKLYFTSTLQEASEVLESLTNV